MGTGQHEISWVLVNAQEVQAWCRVSCPGTNRRIQPVSRWHMDLGLPSLCSCGGHTCDTNLSESANSHSLCQIPLPQAPQRSKGDGSLLPGSGSDTAGGQGADPSFLSWVVAGGRQSIPGQKA